MNRNDLIIFEMMRGFLGKTDTELKNMGLAHYSLYSYDLHEVETHVEFYKPYHCFYLFFINRKWQFEYSCFANGHVVFTKTKDIDIESINRIKIKLANVNNGAENIEPFVYLSNAWKLNKEEIEDNLNILKDYLLFK